MISLAWEKRRIFLNVNTGFAVKSEKLAQKFHTDDVSFPTYGYCFWLVAMQHDHSEALPSSG